MMTIENFARLVHAMRRAQRAYFKMRTLVALDVATQAEREVDRALQAVLPPVAARGPLPGQGHLFGGEEGGDD